MTKKISELYILRGNVRNSYNIVRQAHNKLLFSDAKLYTEVWEIVKELEQAVKMLSDVDDYFVNEIKKSVSE